MEKELIELLKNDDVSGLCNIYMKKGLYEELNIEYVYHQIKDTSNSSVESFIGYLYLQGLYLKQDEQLGINHIKSSADNGNSNAQASYGAWLVKKHYYKTALKYYMMSIEQGNPMGYNNILVLYCMTTYLQQRVRNEMVSKNDFPALEELIEYGLKSHYSGHRSARDNLVKVLKSTMSLSKMVMILSEKKYLLDSKCNKLEEENKALKERVKELEEENVHLKYKPDGIGYMETMEHFNELR